MKRSRDIFLLMFAVFLLLNLNFTILRSLRTTLAVVDLGHGAHSIPIFEILGAMPGALLMTWFLAYLMNRYSVEKVFFITMSTFIGFFLVFNLFMYPFLLHLKKTDGNWNLIISFISMLFYVMSELWKPAMTVILFWGLVNQYIPLDQAKKLYAPLMLAGSLGSIIAGPLISLCTSDEIGKRFFPSTEQWRYSFNLMIIVICFLGMITAFMYYQLWKSLVQNSKNQSNKNDCLEIGEDFSVKKSIYLCTENNQLRLLSWVVIADYIAYSLGEVIFLEILRIQFPEPSKYCNYMGQLSFWSGALTFLSSIFFTPFILNNCRWIVAFLITPFCLLATEGAFFIFLRGYSLREAWFGWSEGEWVGLVIILGSVQYCLCRAAKYTLFDASKEIAFVLMSESQRMKGKLVIDGLCARIGRGSASLLSIGLIKICGGVIASSFFTGLIAIGVVLSWLFSAFKLGKIIDKPKGEAFSLKI